jgi:hypothetical protein
VYTHLVACEGAGEDNEKSYSANLRKISQNASGKRKENKARGGTTWDRIIVSVLYFKNSFQIVSRPLLPQASKRALPAQAQSHDEIAIGRGIEERPAWLAWGVPLLHKPTT